MIARRTHQRDDRTAPKSPTGTNCGLITKVPTKQLAIRAGQSAVAGAAAGAVIGGTVSHVAGGDAWQGATQGAIHGALGGFSRGFFLNRYAQACFTAGTPLVVDLEGNSKPIEQIQVGEMVLARNEFEPNGPLELKRVEELFTRTSPIMELEIGGQKIGTTDEHPFYVPAQERFVPAGELQVGDQLVSHDGRLLRIDAIHSTLQIATVYNLRVADYHTYFVGCNEWGWSVWAHNANCGLASVKDHLEGDTYTLNLNVSGRKGKIQLGKESDRLVAGRHPDTEIVYVVRDRVSGEIVTSGKTSVGEAGVNLRQRVMHYTRDGDFVNSHPDSNVPRVQLEMQLGFVRTQSVKAFQQAGYQVETGVEAPLRANLQKESGLLWDNTNGRLGFPGPKELRNNPQIFQNWVDTRDAWLWQGSGI